MKKYDKLVSVIIAAYNCQDTLEKCVESIINQTYKNIEIIICDDFSNDNTFCLMKKLSEKYSNITILKNEANFRSAYTRNKCIKESNGSYIAIQDADDYSDIRRIETQVEILENEENVSFVSTGMYWFEFNIIWNESLPKVEYPNNKNFLWGLPYAHPTTLFRKSVLEKINSYRVDKETNRTEDMDLFMRLHFEEFTGKNIKDKLYYYNVDKNTFMRRKYEYRIDEAKLRYKFYKDIGLLPIGIIYAIKPLIVGLIPYPIIKIIKKSSNI